MAEQNKPEDEPKAKPTGEGEGAKDTDPTDSAEYWKKRAREWEEKSKANMAAAEELKQLKEAEMSELDKANKHNAELQAELDAMKQAQEQKSWVSEVSKATGVPEAALHGSTKEEVQACADALKDYFKEPAAPNVHLGNPSSDGGQGSGDPLRELLQGN